MTGPDPHDPVAAFWADARMRARLNPVESYLGAGASDTLPPPAWAFGDDAATADRLLVLVLEGRKTATTSVLRDYEEEARANAARDADLTEDGPLLTRTDLDLALPSPGLLSIVLDGAGAPQALIRVTDVAVARFGDVDEEHARREGEGSLEEWRTIHRSAFGGDVDDDTMMVLERFEVLVPAAARRAARRNRLS